MEDATALWSYYQEIVDELKQRLMDKTIEMEAFKIEANEELRKSNDNVKLLHYLFEAACKERDEVRSNLISFRLLPKFDQSSNRTAKFDYPIDSSNSSNNKLMQTIHVDRASLFIESAANGKPLPQKGRLLKAVMESGPLLQTLLVAGPLPRWRNPPPMIPVLPVLDGGSAPRTSSSSSMLCFCKGEFPTCGKLIRNDSNSNGYFQIGNMSRQIERKCIKYEK